MATNNIVENVQVNLGYPPLAKVDPNIHEPQQDHNPSARENLGQAAIPVVLAALYKLSQTDAGSQFILSNEPRSEWLTILYEGKQAEVVDKLAHFAKVPGNEAAIAMEKVVVESVRLIQNTVAPHPTSQAVKNFMADQRHNILVYLPAELQLGYLLNDNTLDDRTNKMEGPVSNFMHKIENKLSGSDS